MDAPLAVGAAGPKVGGGVLFGVDRSESKLPLSDRRYAEGEGDVGGVGVRQGGAPAPEVDVHPVEGVEVETRPDHISRVYQSSGVDAVLGKVGRLRAGGPADFAHGREVHAQVDVLREYPVEEVEQVVEVGANALAMLLETGPIRRKVHARIVDWHADIAAVAANVRTLR